MSADHPLKRDGLEIDEAAAGVVVNDVGRGRVHYLNHAAALIFELCDGRTSADEIVDLVRQAYRLPEHPDEVVRAYLARLVSENLVE